MLKILGFLLLLVAYGLLWPGLTQPMLSVSGSVEKAKLVAVGQEVIRENQDIPDFVKDFVDRIIRNFRVYGSVPAFDKKNSILGTAKELYNNNHVPVAVLILLFSVGIPLLKVLLLVSAHLPFRDTIKKRFLWLSAVTSKWSMVDVFVVALFVAYLAGNGIQEERALVDFESSLESGFYYFLGYCLISILATQLLTGTLTYRDTQKS